VPSDYKGQQQLKALDFKILQQRTETSRSAEQRGFISVAAGAADREKLA
jgi:hypothetical protein